jgi:peptidyl-prolyl cis-trans isomerase D
MMRQMRENTKWIMLFTAIAFVALMVFEWGMDLTGRSSAGVSGGELGRVNGEPVSYEEYNSVYQNLYQQQQAVMEAPMNAVLVRQVEEAAWEQVVTAKLLQQELRRRGIRVTNEEILQAARVAPPPELQSAPAFQTDGEFDLAKYHMFLASPSLDEQFLRQLESYYREVIPRSKLFFQATAGVHVTDGYLWRMYRDANETATIRFLMFSPDAMVPDTDVSVSEQQVRDYYRRHRDDFIRPAHASVRYVAMMRTPGAEDSVAAQERAAELRSAIAAGESFEAAALRVSGDVADRFHGEEFTIQRGQTMPVLEEVAFSTPVGQVSEPVLSPAGYHLVRVESRGGDTARIRQIVIPVELSIQAENRLLTRADSLELAAERSGLAQAAAALGLTVQTGELSPALPFLPGVGGVDEGLDWIFETASAIGETSPVFETPEAFYVLELVSRREEGVLSQQEAAPTIRAVLMRQAKVARARERLADLAGDAAAGRSLADLGARYNVAVQDAGPFTRGDFVPGMGRLNPAIGAAFGLQPGGTSDLVEAENQLFLVQLVERTGAERAEWEAQKEGQRLRVEQAVADSRWQQYMTALRDEAEIVDNRRALLRASAQAAGPLR